MSTLAKTTASLEQIMEEIAPGLEKVEDLRYGENPHQQGILYRPGGAPWPVEMLHGKPMSYLNWWDANGAWSALQDFTPDVPTVAIIKHGGPCGIATGSTFLEAYRQARLCDTTSAYGGIVAFNGEVDYAFAREICDKKHFLEVIIAPSYEAGALQHLMAEKANLRILKHGAINSKVSVRSIFNGAGYLVQTPDMGTPDFDPSTWRCVTEQQPTEDQIRDMLLAWKVAKQAISNAIVFVRDNEVIGLGVGQANRARSVKFAGDQAGDRAVRGVMASDAFFPKPDGLQEALRYGIHAVVQPGGSEQDEAVIALADSCGITMMFTGHRHFRH